MRDVATNQLPSLETIGSLTVTLRKLPGRIIGTRRNPKTVLIVGTGPGVSGLRLGRIRMGLEVVEDGRPGVRAGFLRTVADLLHAILDGRRELPGSRVARAALLPQLIEGFRIVAEAQNVGSKRRVTISRTVPLPIHVRAGGRAEILIAPMGQTARPADCPSGEAPRHGHDPHGRERRRADADWSRRVPAGPT